METPDSLTALLDKYHKGTCTPQEKAEVERYFDALQSKGITPKEVRLNKELKARLHYNISKATYTKQKNRLGFLRIAAVFVALISSTVLINFLFSSKEDTLEFAQAGYGEQLRIVLSDSSIVYLNSGSSLTYASDVESADTRTVILDGEAFFEVTPNPNKPFIVSSKSLQTKVLGTKFSVNTFNEKQPQVIVTEGKVNVSKNSSAKTSIDVTPNQKVTYHLDTGSFEKQEINALTYTAWIEGNIVFDNSSIADVSDIIERRFNVKVTLSNPSVNSCKISGKFKNGDVKELLASIAFINGMEYDFTASGEVTLFATPCQTKN